MTLQKHTTAPLQCVTVLDVHIKAGSGHIVLLPTFVLRSPHFSNLQSTAKRNLAGDQRDARFSRQALGGKETASGNLSNSPDGHSFIKACHTPRDPLECASSQAVSTESKVQESLTSQDSGLLHWHSILPQEPTVQSLVLLAWVRIVVEMYLRDEAVGDWSLEELREHLHDEAVCPDARPTLDACTDLVLTLQT